MRYKVENLLLHQIRLVSNSKLAAMHKQKGDAEEVEVKKSARCNLLHFCSRHFRLFHLYAVHIESVVDF